MGDAARGPEELLARSIRAHRDRLRITAQQLADRIAALGGKLSRQAISKIENGDRSVSVDELFILARALDTAPLLLLFPVGSVDAIEYLPGKSAHPWPAALWFSGEAYQSGDVGTYWAVPLYLFRRHHRQEAEYRELVWARDMFAPAPDDSDRAKADAHAAAVLRNLRGTRAEMRRHGLTPPELADDLKHVDDQRHVFLSSEDVATMRASGELRAYKIVDGRRIFADVDPATGAEIWPNETGEQGPP